MSIDSSGITKAAKYVGMWFTYKKMGLPGWRCIIPFYNMYVLFDELWETKSFWKYAIFRVCSVVISTFALIVSYMAWLFVTLGTVYTSERYYSSDARELLPAGMIMCAVGLVAALGSLALLAVSMVIEFKLYRRLADAFGLGSAWAWGLLFVPYVFFLILGFSKSFVYCRSERIEE